MGESNPTPIPMTPLQLATPNPIENMIKRQALLNHPCEFFRGFFGGRVPSLAEKIAWIEWSMQRTVPVQTWENELYIVRVYHEGPFVHLDITAKDEQPCKSWRHFQEIKNQIVGSSYEAVELFPAEERLVDTSNQYHLWVVADSSYRFPFGFQDRFVLTEPIRVACSETGEIRTSVTDVVPATQAA